MIRRSSHISLSNLLLRTTFYLMITLTLSSLGEGFPITVKNCGIRYAPLGKIVGGDVTIPGEYPWMVSLQQNYTGSGFRHICGASILNPDFVVTAAHCIDVPVVPAEYEIIVGLYNLSNPDRKPAKKYKIAEIIIHSAYDDETYVNDIALLRIEESISMATSFGFINGVCLPETTKDPTGWATVTGWGDTTYGGNKSDVLLAVKVPIVARNLCETNYVEFSPLPQNQICAGFQGRDSCQSDSGGPLVQKDENGVYTLIGIVSYGEGCGLRKYPGVYTKVASFLNWIEDRMMGKPQETTTEETTTDETTTEPTSADDNTVSPPKNVTFSKILLYSSKFQSKLVIMTQK